MFEFFYKFFTPPFLKLVPVGASKIDLVDDDVQALIDSGIFARISNQSSNAPAMHLFTVPEVSKTRRRLIMHTKAINKMFPLSKNDQVVTKFEEILFTQRQCVAQYNFSLDIKSCYNQIPLPQESCKYYSFWVPKFGHLSLTSIPTGQRHCVGVSQVLSNVLLRLSLQTIPKALHSEAYIDNIVGGTISIHTTKDFGEKFARTAKMYRVALNESKEEIRARVGQSFNYRGMRFVAAHIATVPKYLISQTEKTRMKLVQCLEKDIPFIRDWEFSLAESIFGLLMFASYITKATTAEYYYIFKYFRRRQAEIAKGTFERRNPADVWPSTFQLWPSWIRSLLVAEPTDVVERGKSVCRNFVVWTDASLLGWGCIVQWPSGKTISQGGRWSVKEAKLHISELEARAVKIALTTFVPQCSKVEIFIQKCVLHSSNDDPSFPPSISRRS